MSGEFRDRVSPSGPFLPVAPATDQGQIILTGNGIASITNPPGSPLVQQVEVAGVNNVRGQFLNGVQSFMEWALAMPADWDGGSLLGRINWITASAALNNVVWGIQGRIYQPGDGIGLAPGVAIETTSANTGASQVNSAFTAAITLAGTFSAIGQHVQFRAYRLGAGADNLASVAGLLEIVLLYAKGT